MVILIIFAFEIISKLIVYRPYLFLKDPFNIFDFVVIFFSLLFTGLELVTLSKSVVAFRAIRNLYKLLRVLRTVRSIRYLFKGFYGATSSARHLTGRNKQRLVDLENQFDLDLCYINQPYNNLIVMSVPATGYLSLFRNPLKEVQRFFNTKHLNSWRIYNACPEHPYPAFEGGEIKKFNIQDHSPPKMGDFIDFLNDAGLYIRENNGKNVIAVHCRGGKGRSGSLCCAWLLYSGLCETPEEALALFAISRTNENRGKNGKLQGVETPSQKRYIMQVATLLKTQDCYLYEKSQTKKSSSLSAKIITASNVLAPVMPVRPFKVVILPPPSIISLSRLTLNNLFVDIHNVASNGALICTVKMLKHTDEEAPFVSKPVLSELLLGRPVFELDGHKVEGDILVSIYNENKFNGEKKSKDGKKKVVKLGKEKGCLFTFLFHTSFVAGGELNIESKMIDNVVKNRKLYGRTKPYNLATGNVTLNFEGVNTK